MLAVVDLGAPSIHQFQIAFVNESCGVQRLARPAARQLPPGEALELRDRPTSPVARTLPRHPRPSAQLDGDVDIVGIVHSRPPQSLAGAIIRAAQHRDADCHARASSSIPACEVHSSMLIDEPRSDVRGAAARMSFFDK